jgi:DNA-binding LacI/PurR family transcriptional regulator
MIARVRGNAYINMHRPATVRRSVIPRAIEGTMADEAANISVKDVAEFAGVHRTTASRVLSNDPTYRVSDETRRRVLNAARRLGFVRNEHLVLPKKTRSLGVFTIFQYSQHDNPFFSEVFDGIAGEARQQGVNLYLINCMEQTGLVHLLEQREFLGAVFIGGDVGEMLTPFELVGRPAVGVETSADLRSPMLYTIRTPQYEGMRSATEYLIQQGHRRVYYLSFTIQGKPISTSRDRYEGVAMALRQAGLYRGDHQITVELEQGLTEDAMAREMGYRAMEALLGRKPELPIACVCYSDLHAMGACDAAKTHGLRVPEDVSIIGHDNIRRAAQMDPPLTTVNVPRAEMGREAVRCLCELDAGTERRVHETLMPNALVIRNSVAVAG